MTAMARRIAGIDVGGTFTDLVMQEADGTIRIAKVPTTAANQAGGVLDAIAAAGTTPAARYMATRSRMRCNSKPRRWGSRNTASRSGKRSASSAGCGMYTRSTSTSAHPCARRSASVSASIQFLLRSSTP